MGLLVKPIRWPLTLYQGVPFRWAWIWKRGETAATATPVDLTGCTGRAEVWDATGASIAVMTTTTGDGLTLEEADGKINLEISLTKAAALPKLLKLGHWNLKLIWPDGDITRLFEGPVTIDLDKEN